MVGRLAKSFFLFRIRIRIRFLRMFLRMFMRMIYSLSA